MFHRSWTRVAVAGALLCAPLFAGDYDHVFDVVKATWPERHVALTLCDKDANQLTLIDLADTAKARDISLIIMDLRDEKNYPRTLTAALTQKADFVLVIDDDPLLGVKGRLTARLIYRVSSNNLPVVGLSKDLLKLGAALTAGADPKDTVFVNKAVAKRMKITLPDGATDPSEAKK